MGAARGSPSLLGNRTTNRNPGAFAPRSTVNTICFIEGFCLACPHWHTLWTLKRFGVRPLATPLSDPRGRHGPTDHLAYYLERANAEQVFAQLAACSTDLDVKHLESEWGVTDAENLPAVLAAVEACGLEAWVVDRSLPALFGPEWHVVRVFLPDSLEVAWGGCYPRLGSRRYAAAQRGGQANMNPHPIA